MNKSVRSSASLFRFVSTLSRAEAERCVATLRGFAQAVFDSGYTDKLFARTGPEPKDDFSSEDLAETISGCREALYEDLKKYERDIEHISSGVNGNACGAWLKSHGIKDKQTTTGWSFETTYIAGKEHWIPETKLLSVQTATWARRWVAERQKRKEEEKASEGEQMSEDIDRMIKEAASGSSM